MNEFALVLPQSSWDSLVAEPFTWSWGSVTATVGGHTYGSLDLGIRLRGNSSFRPLGQKASFKLDLDRVHHEQRLCGEKSLILSGMTGDSPGMLMTLAFAVFRAAGVPASRTGYAHVTVNGEDYGLYLVLEDYDDVFAARWFPATGHLYEGHYDLDPLAVDRFEVEEGPRDDLGDLLALMNAATSPADDWVGALSPYLDIDAFLKFWAAENWVGQMDGYSNGRANYFLHSDENGVFTLLPWSLDLTFANAEEAPWWDRARLCGGCLADPDCAGRFPAALEAVDEAARGLDLVAWVDRLDALIGPELARDPKATFSQEDRAKTLALLKRFLAMRASSPGGAFEP